MVCPSVVNDPRPDIQAGEDVTRTLLNCECHLSEAQVFARELVDGGATHQLHVSLYFSLHKAERPLDASLAGRSQRIQIVAADADRLGADRERLQDVRSPLHPAIHEHVDPITHGIDDFGQLVERCARAVQLPTTMVGNHDTSAADLNGALRIGGGHDAFEAELTVPLPYHLSHIVPVHGWVKHLRK